MNTIYINQNSGLSAYEWQLAKDIAEQGVLLVAGGIWTAGICHNSYKLDFHLTRHYPDFCRKHYDLKSRTFAVLTGVCVALFVVAMGTAKFSLNIKLLGVAAGCGSAVYTLLHSPKVSSLPTATDQFKPTISFCNFLEKSHIESLSVQTSRLVRQEADYQISKALWHILNKKITTGTELMALLKDVEPKNKPIEQEDIRTRIFNKILPKNGVNINKVFGERLTTIFWFCLNNYTALDNKTKNLIDTFVFQNFASQFFEFRSNDLQETHSLYHKLKIKAPFPLEFFSRPQYKHLEVVQHFYNKINLKDIPQPSLYGQMIEKLIDYPFDNSAGVKVFSDENQIWENFNLAVTENRITISSENNTQEKILPILNHPQFIKALLFLYHQSPFYTYKLIPQLYEGNKIEDPQLMLELYGISSAAIHLASPTLLSSSKFFIDIFTTYRHGFGSLEQADHDLKTNKKDMLTLLRINPQAFSYVDVSLRVDRKFILASDLAISQISATFETDLEVILARFTHYQEYKHIFPSLQNHPQIIYRYKKLLGDRKISHPWEE